MIILPLYIDPGTGSMLFSLIIGLIAAAAFGLRTLYVKLKFILSGGKSLKNEDSENIPYLIFSDHKRYWNVFHGICDEFEKHKVDLTYYTASPDDPVLTANYEFVHAEYLGEGNKPYAKMNMVHADIVIATTPGLGVYQWKRSRYVKWYVHVPHSIGEMGGYRMFALDHYDAVLISGKNQEVFIKKIEGLRPNITRKEIVTVGSTIMDALLERKRSVERTDNTKKVVLLAPSWGESSILAKYGESFLEILSKTNYKVIVRPHPQSVVSEKHILEPLQKKYSQFEWNYDNDNFDVMNKSDVLISDYSGVTLEYSLIFNKPIIYASATFDSKFYDCAWIDEEKWSIKVLPEIGIELNRSDFSDFESLIEKVISDEKLLVGREKVRADCWEFPLNSSALIFNYLQEKHKILFCE